MKTEAIKRAQPDLHSKLLIHRATDFGNGTQPASFRFQTALNEGFLHFEVDVRVSRDDILIVSHDPFLIAHRGPIWIYEQTLEELRAYADNDEILTLDEVLDLFERFGRPDATLHIDAKDPGAEVLVRCLSKRPELWSRIVVVSWIPSLLQETKQALPKIRLCFSHLTAFRLPSLYRAGLWLARRSYFYDAIARLPIFDVRSSLMIRALSLIERPYLNERDMARGKNYFCVERDFVMPVTRKLVAPYGYICIPAFMATKELVRNYHKQGMQVAVFSITNSSELFQEEERVGADLYYLDGSWPTNQNIPQLSNA